MAYRWINEFNEMKFAYHVNYSIPQAAWCAEITSDDDIIRVELGRSVPFNEDFFVSGVWDGDFEKGDFTRCKFACCTGAVLTDVNRGG